MSLAAPKYRNPNPPAWFLAIRDEQQARMDHRYLHGPTGNSVDSYLAAAGAWIEDQTRKRAASADPEKYVPEPFTREVPRREVWDITEEGEMYTWLMDPDPSIQPPVLPPFAKPSAPGGGFKTSPDPKDAALFSLLTRISADVAAIKAKVGA